MNLSEVYSSEKIAAVQEMYSWGVGGKSLDDWRETYDRRVEAARKYFALARLWEGAGNLYEARESVIVGLSFSLEANRYADRVREALWGGI